MKINKLGHLITIYATWGKIPKSKIINNKVFFPLDSQFSL